MISSRQIKAARALLDWSQDDLAQKSGVSPITVKRAEKSTEASRAGILEAIERALMDAGIEFIGSASKEGATVLKGKVRKR